MGLADRLDGGAEPGETLIVKRDVGRIRGADREAGQDPLAAGVSVSLDL
jgi:hypothetical protein